VITKHIMKNPLYPSKEVSYDYNAMATHIPSELNILYTAKGSTAVSNSKPYTIVIWVCKAASYTPKMKVKKKAKTPKA
jgi:hypothetical protein